MYSLEDKLIVIGGISFVVLIILFIAAVPFLKLSNKGSGQHVGYITAVDQKGYFFKNYDVYFKTDNQSSQEDVYCIYRENTDLVNKAKEASRTRKLVTVEYKGVFGWGLDICEGEEIKDIK